MARTLAFLFALLAIYQVYQLFRRGGRGHLLGASLFGALTVVTHLETAWFAFFSIALLWLFYGRSRDGATDAAMVVAGVALLISRWFIAVVAQHGLEPLLSAGETGGHSWESWRSLPSWEFAELPYLNWAAALAIGGAVCALSRGDLLLPIWLVAIVFLDPRAGPTYATVPLALLVATGLSAIVGHLWQTKPSSFVGALGERPGMFPALAPYWPRIAAVALVLYVGALAARGALLDHGLLRGVGADQRDLMAWIDQNVGAGDFAVITDIVPAWVDPVGEWFPVLTGHRSVATPQGYEWFGRDELGAQVGRSFELQSCSRQSVDCLEGWLERHADSFSYVYIAAGCCQKLRADLKTSALYGLLAEHDGGAVFERREP